MADAATKGQGSERPDPDFLDPSVAVVIPNEDGGATIDFDGARPEAGIDATALPLTPIYLFF